MVKHYIFVFALVVTVSLAGVGFVQAETTNATTMKAQIEILLKKIAELQAQLKAAQGEINDLIKAGLTEGMTDEAIKEIQELLATDPEIYPSGLATGYFGPMTKEAIKRFQTKFGLEVTGTLNEETRQALSEVRKERRENQDGDLLKNPAVRDKIKNRLKEKWENCDYVRPGKEAFCKDKKDSDDDDDDSMEDEDEDEDDDMSDDSDDKEVTRDDARRAVVDAKNELNRFRADIKDMEDDDADEDEVDDAKDMLKKAQAEMAKARKALARQEFDDAYESAEEVIEILEGNDDSMDDDDDEDDSDDDDDDEEDDDEEDED